MEYSGMRFRCPVCRHPVLGDKFLGGFYVLVSHKTRVMLAADIAIPDGVDLRCAGSGQLVHPSASL